MRLHPECRDFGESHLARGRRERTQDERPRVLVSVPIQSIGAGVCLHCTQLTCAEASSSSCSKAYDLRSNVISTSTTNLHGDREAEQRSRSRKSSMPRPISPCRLSCYNGRNVTPTLCAPFVKDVLIKVVFWNIDIDQDNFKADIDSQPGRCHYFRQFTKLECLAWLLCDDQIAYRPMC